MKQLWTVLSVVAPRLRPWEGGGCNLEKRIVGCCCFIGGGGLGSGRPASARAL